MNAGSKTIVTLTIKINRWLCKAGPHFKDREVLQLLHFILFIFGIL